MSFGEANLPPGVEIVEEPQGNAAWWEAEELRLHPRPQEEGSDPRRLPFSTGELVTYGIVGAGMAALRLWPFLGFLVAAIIILGFRRLSLAPPRRTTEALTLRGAQLIDPRPTRYEGHGTRAVHTIPNSLDLSRVRTVEPYQYTMQNGFTNEGLHLTVNESEGEVLYFLPLEDYRIHLDDMRSLLEARIARARGEFVTEPAFAQAAGAVIPEGVTPEQQYAADAAWWDAPKVEISRDGSQTVIAAILSAVFAMVGISILWNAVVSPPEWDPITIFSTFLGGLFALVGLMSLWRLNVKGPIIAIAETTVEDRRPRQTISVRGERRRGLPGPVQLADIEKIVPYRIPRRRGSYNGVELYVRTGALGAEEPVYVVPLDMTKMNEHDMATLLTYRIAKAKGENPPPPAFL